MASLQVDGSMLETSCGSPHYACPEVIRVSLLPSLKWLYMQLIMFSLMKLGREIRWTQGRRLVMWSHLVRIARRSTSLRRRQLETTARKNQERSLPDTVICAGRLSRVIAQNDRDWSSQTFLGTYYSYQVPYHFSFPFHSQLTFFWLSSFWLFEINSAALKRRIFFS